MMMKAKFDGAAKRSIESTNVDDGNASRSKRVKITDQDDTTEKGDALLPSSSQTVQLKRSGDSLHHDSPYQSPAKKKKTDNQSGSGKARKKSQQRGDEGDKKKKRTKNKALLKAVVDQMEFYFSDSSLSKDRFLRKLYDESEDGYVDLTVFGNFNKLQTLHKDGISLNLLSKALSNSKLLEMNEDRTRVKRRKPFVEPDQKEVDSRTVYVERLPSHATHAWIKKIFSQCGQVSYVSLPTYRTSKQIKRFAFVEFSSTAEAEKACNMLNNPPPEKMEEKPGKFPKGSKDFLRLQKYASEIKEEEKDGNEEDIPEDSKEEQAVAPLTPTKKKKKKNLKKNNEDNFEKAAVSEEKEGQGEKKKKKKKKKKQPLSESVNEGKNLTGDLSTANADEGDSNVVNSAMDVDKGEDLKDTDNDPEKRGEKTKKKRKKKKKKNEAKTSCNIKEEVVDKPVSENAAKGEADITIECSDNCPKEKLGNTKMEEELTGENGNAVTDDTNNEGKLSRKERKLLRQADIRRKKEEGLFKSHADTTQETQSVPGKDDSSSKSETQQEIQRSDVKRQRLESVVSESSETDDSSQVHRKKDGTQLTSCLVKSKKQDVVKKVEFDPIPLTTEFVERKEIRRRKKAKREILHLRVLSKQEWLTLKEEYISKQKSHMSALKESLRELRRKEMEDQPETKTNGAKHVDLTHVFGTKRLKPSHDIKLAHVEELQFIPNVIVQWNCSHEINRNSLKTLFKEIDSDRIAYIESQEVAKSGYIRFKDEGSAEEFARLTRRMDSFFFSARVLPESQQAKYWEKANKDRLEKLSKKKKERGSDKITRKVLERNKATFHEKGIRIVFDNDDREGDAADGEAKGEKPTDTTDNTDNVEERNEQQQQQEQGVRDDTTGQ